MSVDIERPSSERDMTGVSRGRLKSPLAATIDVILLFFCGQVVMLLQGPPRDCYGASVPSYREEDSEG